MIMEAHESECFGRLPLRTMRTENFKVSDTGLFAEEEVKERAKRAAAAARRWREYSRKGADKPPTYKLPEAIPNKKEK